MVVNCPNCNMPNDADQERCQQCNARIPMSLRRQAMIPKQQVRQQATEFDASSQTGHREAGRETMKKTSGDAIGRRSDARSLRKPLEARDTGMPTSSEQKYAPPPAVNSASQTASGRSYTDTSRYRASVGQSGTPAPQSGGAAPSYMNKEAWEAQHGNLPQADAAFHALASSGHADPNAALGAHQGGAPPVPVAPRPGGYTATAAPGTPGYSGAAQQGTHAAAAPGISGAQAASWQANQIESASEAATAAALASSAMSDPMAALNASTQAAAPHGHQAYAPAPPAQDGATQAMTAVPGTYAPTASQSAPAAPAGYQAQAPAGYQAQAPASHQAQAPAGYQAHAPHVPSIPKPTSGESIISEGPATGIPQARKTPKALLVFIDDQGRQREQLPLPTGKTVIGRTEGEILLPSDPYVSPWHAQITVTGKGVSIKDMYSRNGIFKRIKRQAVLQDGDRFFIGNQVLKFRYGWNETKPDDQETMLLGGTNPSSPARVYVLTASGEIAGLTPIRDVLTIGRTRCDLSIPEDPALADKHAQIQWDGHVFLLIDLNSPSGVYLSIRGEADLDHKDTIQIGRQRLMIERPQAAGQA